MWAFQSVTASAKAIPVISKLAISVFMVVSPFSVRDSNSVASFCKGKREDREILEWQFAAG
jgi:hypothetical protein